MKTILLHIIPLLIIVTAGCSSSDSKQPVVEKKPHPVSITGIVTSISRVNIGNSGTYPKIMLHFIVKIEFYDDGGWDTILGPEAEFVCGETDLLRQTGRKLETGLRITITADIIEKSPDVIAVNTITLL